MNNKINEINENIKKLEDQKSKATKKIRELKNKINLLAEEEKNKLLSKLNTEETFKKMLEANIINETEYKDLIK